MIQCKICDVDNSEDSKFCIECGASTNNGKEQKRIVSAEEMKNYLWSFDFSKVRDKKGLSRMIRTEIQKWKQDPHYIPIISAPTKTGGFIQVPQNVDMKEFKKEWEEQKRDMGFDAILGSDAPLLSTIKSNDVSSGGGLNNEGLRLYNENDTTYNYMMNLKHQDLPVIEICGVCGTYDCQEIHIPTIQLQYQEAFENIQHLRHRKYLKYCLSKNPRELDVTELREYGLRGIKDYRIRKASDLAKIYYPHLFHDDVFPKQKDEPKLTSIKK